MKKNVFLLLLLICSFLFMACKTNKIETKTKEETKVVKSESETKINESEGKGTPPNISESPIIETKTKEPTEIKNINITIVDGNESFEINKNCVLLEELPDYLNIEGLYFDESFTLKYDYQELTSDTTLYILKKSYTDYVNIVLVDGDTTYNIYDNYLKTSYIKDVNSVEGIYYDKDYRNSYNGERLLKDNTLYVKRNDSKNFLIEVHYDLTSKYFCCDSLTIEEVKKEFIEFEDYEIELYYDSAYEKPYNGEKFTNSKKLYLKIISEPTINKQFKIYYEDKRYYYDGDTINTNIVKNLIPELNDKYFSLYLDSKYLNAYNGEYIDKLTNIFLKFNEDNLNIKVYSGDFPGTLGYNYINIAKGKKIDIYDPFVFYNDVMQNSYYDLYYDKECTQKYNGEYLYANTTLYGVKKYYDTFIKVIVDSIEYDCLIYGNNYFSINRVPNNTDYHYLGLYYDKDFNDPYNNEIINISDELPTLYMKYEKVYNTLTYYINNIKFTTTIKNYINIEDLISLEGYKIVDLYLDESLTNKFDYSKVLSDITLYCEVLKENETIITYFIGDKKLSINSHYASIEHLNNDNISLLYYDANFTKPYNGEYLNKNTDIYVKESNNVIISYYINGMLYAKDIIENGTPINTSDLNFYNNAVYYLDKDCKIKYNNEIITKDTSIYISHTISDSQKDKNGYSNFVSYSDYAPNNPIIYNNDMIIKYNLNIGTNYNSYIDFKNLYLDDKYQYSIDGYYLMNSFELYTDYNDLFKKYNDVIIYNNKVIGYRYANIDITDSTQDIFTYFDFYTKDTVNNIIKNGKDKNVVSLIIGKKIYQIALINGLKLTKEDILSFTNGCEFDAYVNNELFEYGNIYNNLIIKIILKNTLVTDSNNNELTISPLDFVSLDLDEYIIQYGETGVTDKPLVEVEYEKYYYTSCIGIKKNVVDSNNILLNFGFSYHGNVDGESLIIKIGNDIFTFNDLSKMTHYNRYIIKDNNSYITYNEPAYKFCINIADYLNNYGSIDIQFILGEKLLNSYTLEIENNVISTTGMVHNSIPTLK